MRTVASVAAGLAVAAATFLSPALLEAQQPARFQWTASAGRATFAFRDVSRNIRPVDASPVTWEGAGPALHGRFERVTRPASHRVDVTWTSTSRFEYVSPLRQIAAAATDKMSAVSARYEYRRYFFRDVGVRGFDVGASAEGGVTRTSLQRDHAAFVARQRASAAMVGAAIAARLTRWPRLTLEGSWTNGVRSSNQSDGWYDAWLATAQVRMTGGLALLIEFTRTSDVAYRSHSSYISHTPALLLGVTYAR